MTVSSTPPSFATLFSQHDGYLVDKWVQFLPLYERELGPAVARGQPLRLLEIGVQNGGSLELWHKYLPRSSQIIGVDIDPKCQQLTFPEGVKVLLADASNAEQLDNVLGDAVFDFIIDDGSHKQSDIVQAFLALFPRLEYGGKYIIEDLHTSYWATHEGGLRRKGSSIEFLKMIVDALHLDYFGDANATENDNIVDEAEMRSMRTLNADVGCIKFYDSIAVVEKYIEPKQSRFLRVVSGSQMHVTGPVGLAEAVLDHPREFALFGRSWETVADTVVISAQRMAASEAARAAALSEQVAELQAELERQKNAQVRLDAPEPSPLRMEDEAPKNGT